MLRAAVALLLLANLAFFVWVRGGLAPGFPPPQHGEREPQRLAGQLQPELVRVLPATAASAAVRAAAAAATVCLEAGPFRQGDVAAAEALLSAALIPASGAEGGWVREPLPAPPEAVVLRLTRATADQQQRLQALPADALAGGFRPCAGAPTP